MARVLILLLKKSNQKFLSSNEIKKNSFLIPKLSYENEIKKGIKLSKLKASKIFTDTDYTKPTNKLKKLLTIKLENKILKINH